MDSMDTVGRIKDFRKYLRLSQGELAKQLGITQSALSQYEGGQRRTPIEVLQKLSALGMDLNWFSNGDGAMVAEPKSAFGNVPSLTLKFSVPDGAALEEAAREVDALLSTGGPIPPELRWKLISIAAAEIMDMRALGRPPEDIRKRLQDWFSVAMIGLHSLPKSP